MRPIIPVFAAAMFALWLPAAAARAAPKTDLVLALPGEPEHGYDPIMGWGEYGALLFQSALLTRDADLKAQPDLARTWTLSPDRLTWTITIRDDVTFSDGTKLTAEDVAFTFAAAAKAGGAADLTVLASAQATGPTTVELKLKEPRVTFQESFFELGIVPAKTYTAEYGRHPVGSGPYRFVHWDQGQQLIVEANPLYHGPKSAFQKLTFLFIGEDASFAAARTGTLDMVAVPPALADKVPGGMRRVAVKTVDNRGIVLPMVANTGRKDSVGAPIGNDVTADPAIRKAINVAIDRQALVEHILLGHGRPAHGPADLLPWSNPDDQVKDADPRAATGILDAAGWKPGPDGIRSKDGREARFSIVYFAFDSTRQALALAVADMLRPIGIVAEPIGKSREETKRLMHAQPVLFGWGSHNPIEVYYLYDSRFSGPGYYNAGYYSNPKVDAHFDQAERAESLDASMPSWRAAQWDGETGYGVRGDAAWAWLVNLDHIYFVNQCLDIGKTQIEPHGHGWPITAGVANWRWTCD